VSRQSRRRGGAVRGGVGFALRDSGGVETAEFATSHLRDSGEGEKSR
jgi:hypothetical protein